MKLRFAPILFLGLFSLLLLQGCSPTSHPLDPLATGKPSSSAEMERLLSVPGPVQLETINSADWSTPLAGLLNLSRPAAVQAGLKDREEPIQVYAHWIKHPQRGNYLVDTGVAQKLLDDPGAVGISWLMQKVMHLEKIKLQKSTAAILQDMQGKLSGVFFTHLHIDHISGLPEIPDEVPLYIGKTESSGKHLINLFVQGSTNQILENKQRLHEWNFQADPQNRFEGIVDVFEDGSVFAISVPGHTSGSTAYLVRTPQGPVLLTGDTSHTRWGWDHAVEPGDFTRDHDRNLKNLISLKELVARHPHIRVRLGHQP